MVVGVLRVVLQIPGAASLKAKRQVVRSLSDRLRSRFNVSVAEVGENDRWQKAVFGVSAVSNDRAFVNEVLDKVLRAIDESGVQAVIVDHELEILTLSEMYGAGSGQGERTLAEVEGLVPGVEPFDDDEDLPSLEELEDAAASWQQASPPRGGRRR